MEAPKRRKGGTLLIQSHPANLNLKQLLRTCVNNFWRLNINEPENETKQIEWTSHTLEKQEAGLVR